MNQIRMILKPTKISWSTIPCWKTDRTAFSSMTQLKVHYSTTNIEGDPLFKNYEIILTSYCPDHPAGMPEL